jgi:hypothetical protein
MNRSSHMTLLKLLIIVAALLLASCKPLVSLAVSTASPGDESVTFSKGSDVVLGADGSLEVAIAEDFASYQWILDGAVVAGETSRAVTIDCAPLAGGVHHLTGVVGKSGHLYSKTLRFVVAN